MSHHVAEPLNSLPLELLIAFTAGSSLHTAFHTCSLRESLEICNAPEFDVDINGRHANLSAGGVLVGQLYRRQEFLEDPTFVLRTPDGREVFRSDRLWDVYQKLAIFLRELPLPRHYGL